MTIVCLILMLGIVVFYPSDIFASAQNGGEAGSLAVVNIGSDLITWQPLVDYASLTLTVASPSGVILTRKFDAGNIPVLSVGELPDDGLYSYELRLTSMLDAKTQASMQNVAEDPEARTQLVDDLTAAGVLPAVTSQSGSFTISSGQFVIPVEEEVSTSSPSGTSDGGNTINDVLHYDDVIVTGSLCVGFDCVDGESFGFDTFKLKENNLQIFFDDTSSSAGFPANDWRLIANDSSSGGANYFKIVDSTNSREPFKIMAGARTNGFFMSSSGRIGFGTSTPVLDLHIVRGDTPGMRLDQDTSSGWTAQVWDIAGNESNFFIRDSTNGSKLPFRIQPNTPSSTLSLKSSGNVGIGTWSPAYPLEVETTGKNSEIVAHRTDGAMAVVSALTTTVQIGSITNHDLEMVVNDSPVMSLTSKGEMTLQGSSGVAGEFFAGDSAVQIGSATDNDVQLVVNSSPVMSLTGAGEMTLQAASSSVIAGVSTLSNTVQVGSLSDHDLSLVVNSNPVMSLSTDGDLSLQGASGSAIAGLSALTDTVQIGSRSNHDVEMIVNDTVVMTVTSAGNMTLQGALSEYSDVNVKENFSEVDGYEVLDRLNNIPITTWNYISDDSGIQHMGPMAQDFYAAFELGADNRHIASLDVNGVSLAAIQTLSKITTDQKTEIDKLEAENTALKEKVDGLETRLSNLEQSMRNSADNQAPIFPIGYLLIVVLIVGVMQAAPVIYRKKKQIRN